MNRWLFYLAAVLGCLSGKAQTQLVSPSPSQITVAQSSAFTVDVNYTTQPLQPLTTGLTVRIHYNSSQIAGPSLLKYWGQGLLANLPVNQADTADLDGDPLTDRYMLMSWLAVSADWPGSLPIRLYRASFPTLAGFSGTTLRFSGDSANGYTFSANPLVLTPPLPGILVQPTAGLSTSESGASASFSVALKTQPSTTVTIGLHSSDLGEGTIQPTSIQFNSVNWQTPQFVTITGIDDPLVDGNISYTIVTDPAVSADPAYQGLDAANVSVINQDDDATSEPTLSVPVGLTARPGTSLIVPVLLSELGSATYTSFDFGLSYDPSLMQFSDLVTQGTASAGWTVIANNSQPATLRVGGISTSAVSAGTLIGIQFTIPANAPDGSCSDLVLQNGLFDTTTAQLQPGRCCMVACIKGDGNGDNQVQVFDGSLALLKAIGLPTPFDPIPLNCLDADCDGNLLAEDGSLIMRYALGLITQLCGTPAPAPRRESIEIALAKQQRVSGESFAIPVAISAVAASDGIYSYQFTLDYDPTLLSLEGLDLENTMSTGWTLLINDTEPGRIIVGAMSTTPLDGEGTLLHLRARALEGEGSLSLNWRQFLFGAGQPSSATGDGQVEIQLNQAPQGLALAILCEQGNSSRAFMPEVLDGNPGDHHSFALIEPATQGSVLLGEQGFVYDAAPDFVGEDQFRYSITDAGGLSDEVEAHVLVLGSSFFNALNAWPLGDVNALIAAINDPLSTLQSKRPQQRPSMTRNMASSEHDRARTETQTSMEQAWRWVDAGDVPAARARFETLVQSGDPEQVWMAQSALVALDRIIGDSVAAYEQTARIAQVRPDLAPLMQLWDGDTAVLAGDIELATALYNDLLEGHEFDYVDGVSLGSRALTQQARAQIGAGQPAAAAEYLRRLLREHGYEVNREFILAQALLYEAMANGHLPMLPLESLAQNNACGTEPCLVGGEDGLGEPIVLAGLSAFRFVISPRDIADLEVAVQSKGSVTRNLSACTVTAASTGFQVPLADTRATGYTFMEPIGSGQYHPGFDINVGSTASSDCGLAFKAVASGCVRDSSPSNWGSAVIEHLYTPESWYSQYGHASSIYFSIDAAISKGATLGLVGDVGTVACHLHHELRESDHPEPTNADYYSNLSWENVGDWYDDPTSFEQAHRSYHRVYWVDEQAFSTQGNWTYRSDVGHRDDLIYAETTAIANKENIATRSFLPSSSGQHELWVFIPYNYGDSKKVTYSLLKGSILVMEATFDQSVYSDAWICVGSVYLNASTQYKLGLASNTGESNLRVALDDVMLIQR